MDGLMLDTERPTADFWIQAAREAGWEISRAAVHRTIGINEKSSRAVYAAEYGSEFPYSEIKQEVYRRVRETAGTSGIPCKPGLFTLLDHLEKLHIPAAVASSTAREYARWKLEKAGVLSRFPIAAFGDEVEHSKPAPDVFLLAARRLGVSPDRCIGFEDSPAGLCGLASAGIRSVFIKDLLDPPEEVMATVWRQYNNLAEAVELFIRT
jgi:HAD superfamily hydrolase (TIGR01509 family)